MSNLPEGEFEVPDSHDLPRHVAIIMDGNGRWARKRKLPRTAGHQAGVRAVRDVVEFCGRRGIGVLTLFAFSRENWQRPESEVGNLMELLLRALKREADSLAENGVRLRFVGDRTPFEQELREHMERAEARTRHNDRMILNVAVNYSGRWDILQAVRKLVSGVADGVLTPDEIGAATLERELAFAGLPDPDLFIRSGGDQRISNFLLWQLAYTELYFTNVLWPDFGPREMEAALRAYVRRQRRFGRTGEQVAGSAGSC